MEGVTTLGSKLHRLSACILSNTRASPRPTVSTSSAPRDRNAYYMLRYFSEKPFLHAPSKRRVKNSPTLSLEAVALPALLSEQVQKYINRHNLTPRQLRANAATINSARAPESLKKKPVRNLGQPVVLSSPVYDNPQTAAFAAIRMPGTYTANIFVIAEAARLLPDFSPSSILDFGSGPGTSLLAASRVFSPQHASCSTQQRVNDCITLSKASLVDRSSCMRSLSAELISTDPTARNTAVTHLSDLRECSHEETFDIVSCSYALHEIARDALSSTSACKTSSKENRSVNRADRVRAAEARLLRTAKALWSRTAPNGLFIVIEDGTASGFETVSFVRDFLVKNSAPLKKIQIGNESIDGEAEEASQKEAGLRNRPKVTANIIAPCLHSESCPLAGSITRHRVCRFQQRFNRPRFSRSASPMSTGYEDERFSFLVAQKIVGERPDEKVDTCDRIMAWGRLIREPLLNGKHVTLDACTKEANLERRIVAKNKEKGMYSQARRAKWGDVWPHVPSAAPQQLNF